MWRLDDPDAPKDGMIIANTAEWDNPVAVEVYRAALNKDVQRAIVTPSEGGGPALDVDRMGLPDHPVPALRHELDAQGSDFRATGAVDELLPGRGDDGRHGSWCPTS